MTRARIEPCRYGGWEHNLRLANGEFEAVVTLDVGPRIIRYAAVGADNLLGEMPDELGRSGEPTWQMRGGHRLWASPEDPAVTYAPDNAPVAHAVDGGRLIATTERDARFGLERTMEIALAATGPELTIVHRIRNRGNAPCQLAPWALTVMAPGGIAVLPLPPMGRHPGTSATSPKDFAPHLSLALWPYFRFDDARVTLGRSSVRLRQDRGASGPTKLGLALRAGWAAYWNRGTVFVKRFSYEEGAPYPDGGCNFETYTDAKILELESLGPLVTLDPGGETSHTERWSIVTGVVEPSTEDITDHAFFPRISSHAAIEIG
jgi:hypothetical protein